MRYHIYKSSRSYSGEPYCGPSSNNKPAEAETLQDADLLVKKMLSRNTVGWIIYDTESKKDVL